MYRITHIFLGLSTGLLICSSIQYSLLCGLSGAFGAYIPDIGHAPYRRGRVSHSLVLPITLILLMFSINNILVSSSLIHKLIIDSSTYTIYSISTGWITHVLSDALTSQGVYFLYPFLKYRLRVFKKLRSNSIVGNLSIIILSAIIMYMWLIKTGLNIYIEYLLKIFSSIFS